MRLHRRFSTPRRLAVAAIVAGVTILPLLMPSAGADQVSDKQAEAQRISARLAELDARQVDLNAEYERANYALHQAEDAVTDAQRTSDEAAAELEQRRADLSRFAVEAYQTGNDSPELSAMLTTDGNLAPQKKGYLQATSGNRQDLIDALNASKEKADADAAQLESAKEDAQSHADEIDRARADAQTARDQQRALNSQVQGELATLVAQETAKRQDAAAAAAAAAAPATQPAANGAPSTTTAAAATNPGAPAAPAPAPAARPAPAPSAPPPPAGSGASGAIAAALSQVGKPYVWGAAGPDSYDCSGLVLWAYARVGVSLPHFSGAQYAMTTRITRDQLQPGDLVFWGGGGSEHVAIYMGGNSLVHAFGSGVTTSQLDGWWKPPSGYGRLH